LVLAAFLLEKIRSAVTAENTRAYQILNLRSKALQNPWF
jgi:hypothetical protein